MPSEELSCLLPKDLLHAFSVTNRTLRELLLSELQKSSLIRPLNRRNSRTPSMLRLSLQRRAVDTLETVNDVMNESWALHLVRGLFLRPAAGADFYDSVQIWTSPAFDSGSRSKVRERCIGPPPHQRNRLPARWCEFLSKDIPQLCREILKTLWRRLKYYWIVTHVVFSGFCSSSLFL